jgi:predicted nucleic acid-binding protein
MEDKWILLDTNVWIFGLRNAPDHPHCRHILANLSQFHVSIPRQVLRELLENLDQKEMIKFFQLINLHSGRIAANWTLADAKLIKKYELTGCKKGDAVVAAHAEALNVGTLITENRGFLRQYRRLPFVIMNSEEFLRIHGL